MATRVESDSTADRRSLALTAHHMTGKTSLGKVPGEEDKKKRKPTADYEYDPFEAGDFAKGWVGNVVAGELVPFWIGKSKELFPDDKYPFLTGKYGPTIRSRSAIFAAVTASGLIATPLAYMVRAALHNVAPGIANAPEGPIFKVPPPNLFVAGAIKTVSTGLMKTWLTSALAPPPPKPAPAPPAPPKPGTTPAPKQPQPPAKLLPGGGPQSATSPTPVADAAKGPTFLGKDLKSIAHESLMYGVSYVLGKVYDQTVGPVVQKSVNRLMGRIDEEVKKAPPMTPGGLASALTSAFVSSLILKPVKWQPLPGGGTGGAGGAAAGAAAAGGTGSLFATAAVNGLLATAFDTVYSAGVGPAIEDGVNALAGYPKAERTPGTFTLERVLRTMARTGVSASTYYLVDGATRGIWQGVGASVGGAMGAFVAMAGPALTGMVSSGVIDALIGAKVGSAAGSIFSWVTGKPKAENAPPVEAKPAAAAAATATAPLRPQRKRTHQPGLAAPADVLALGRIAARAAA